VQLPLQVELVPLGVSSEIVVIVENQNSGMLTATFAVEVRSREAADASSYHNEIELLLGINRVTRVRSVANRVCRRIRAFVTTPKAR
jgi:hypothetical protein